MHVVSSVKLQKMPRSRVDAVLAEGFEAFGHNGREETTTLSLISNVRRNIKFHHCSRRNFAVGSQMKQILGADGVQIGSRFAATVEASNSS